MGYTTEFDGSFEIDPPLSDTQVEWLRDFAEQRHFTLKSNAFDDRHPAVLRNQALGLGVGPEGRLIIHGLEYGDDRIADYNDEGECPGLWCQWVPTEDGSELQWDGNEKFYSYGEWLQFLIDNVFKPWGCKLTGTVTWQGEDPDDFGRISTANHKVRKQPGRKVYD